MATVRALKYHGGVELADLKSENLAALEKGIVNLERHIDNVRNRYGLPCVVAINRRGEDTEREIKLLIERLGAKGVRVIAGHATSRKAVAARWSWRSEVVRLCEQPSGFRFVYEDGATLWDKMKAIATKIYHASDITADTKVRDADPAAAGQRLRALPGVRGQDPVFLLDRPETARRSRAATWSTSARCASPPARSSSS